MTVKDKLRTPVIVAAARTAVGKAKKGKLATTRPDDLAAAVVQELFQRAVIKTRNGG